MESSIYAFADDMRAEGPVRVLDRIGGYGCDGVTVAAAYHRARDVTPHGPARVTLRQDGVHFGRRVRCSAACGWHLHYSPARATGYSPPCVS